MSDVYNGILVNGNTLGNTMYYGRGAGKLPTASAVVADVIDCAKHLGTNIFCFWDAENLELSKIDHASRKFFVRMPKTDVTIIEGLFGEVTYVDGGIAEETAFVTEKITEKEFAEKVQAAGTVISKIRVEE